MTPASFAKLSLRLFAAGIAFLFVADEMALAFDLMFSSTELSQLPRALTELSICIAIGLALLLIWMRAGWLGRFLLPEDSDALPSADYDDWQRVGLMFIGACMLLRVLLGLPMLVMASGLYLQGAVLPDTAMFDLIIGFVLLLGWRVLIAVIKRLFTTNWWRVLLIERRRRLDRAD